VVLPLRYACVNITTIVCEHRAGDAVTDADHTDEDSARAETDRRTFVRTVAAAVVLGAATTTVGTASAQSAVTVSLNNVGASAWEVTDVQGADGIAPLGEENPELNLTVGTRYTFLNGGWPSHPLAFREAGGAYSSGTALLTQDGDGALEDDRDVDWVDEGEQVSFTLTQTLADRLDRYRCTVHGSMEGVVTTTSNDTTPSTPDYDDPDGRVFFETIAGETVDGGGIETTAEGTVTVGMGAEGFVVEPASEGVEPGHGHLHLLVDQPAVAPGEVIPNDEERGYYHYGDGQTTAELDLAAGRYTVRVQAGDANHLAYDLTDRVELTVRDGALGRFDGDGDGQIGSSDVLDAIDAFSTDRSVGDQSVEVGDVLDLISAFNDRRPV
jgi:hypothetical protein